MTPELKARWVKALRSGRYRQAHEYLRTGGGNCCLGVLCRVALPLGWTHQGGDDFSHDLSDEMGAKLTNGGLARVGLTRDQQECLIRMNDSNRSSFRQIADWIEANVEAKEASP